MQHDFLSVERQVRVIAQQSGTGHFQQDGMLGDIGRLTVSFESADASVARAFHGKIGVGDSHRMNSHFIPREGSGFVGTND